jgi:hypothetical protein
MFFLYIEIVGMKNAATQQNLKSAAKLADESHGNSKGKKAGQEHFCLCGTRRKPILRCDVSIGG